MTSVTLPPPLTEGIFSHKKSHLSRIDEPLGDERVRRNLKPSLPSVKTFYAKSAVLGRSKSAQKPRPAGQSQNEPKIPFGKLR